MHTAVHQLHRRAAITHCKIWHASLVSINHGVWFDFGLTYRQDRSGCRTWAHLTAREQWLHDPTSMRNASPWIRRYWQRKLNPKQKQSKNKNSHKRWSKCHTGNGFQWTLGSSMSATIQMLVQQHSNNNYMAFSGSQHQRCHLVLQKQINLQRAFEFFKKWIDSIPCSSGQWRRQSLATAEK